MKSVGDKMNPLSEYQILINYHFIATNIAGVIAGSMFLFILYYFFYVEKTFLALYLNIYISLLLLGSISQSYLILSRLGFRFNILPYQLISIDTALDILIIYSMFLIALYFLQYRLIALRIIYFALIPILFMLGYSYNVLWEVFFIYLYLIMGTCIALTIKEMKTAKFWENLLFIGIFLLIIIYYTLAYTITLFNMPFNSYEWIFVILVVLSMIIYFTFRYQKILLEKEVLFQRLTRDFLTHTYSKSYFLEVLDKTPRGVIMFIDINHFKYVNDQFGHVKGDELLKAFAEKLLLFDSEISIVCRFGGDEFALLLKNNNIELSQILALDLINNFKETLSECAIENTHHVGISIGIATFSDFRGKEALHHADFAMYESKGNGNYKLTIHLEEGGGL